MSKVIIINGVAQSGKDTFCNIYSKYSYSNTWIFSTITPVKDIAEQMGWDGRKDDKSRKFLSDLKILWSNYNDELFNLIIDKVKRCLISNDNIIFIHCREPEEIIKFKAVLPNCSTLLIERDNIPIPNNSADQNVFNYQYDFVIENNGTLEELKLKVKEFIETNES